jgi:hypothetical protein
MRLTTDMLVVGYLKNGRKRKIMTYYDRVSRVLSAHDDFDLDMGEIMTLLALYPYKQC